MTTNIAPSPVAQANTKPLWAAIGALSVALLAMAAGMLYMQSRPADTSAMPRATAVAVETAPAVTVAAAQATLQPDEIAPAHTKPAATALPRAPAKSTLVRPAPAAVASPAPLERRVRTDRPAPRAICGNCGRVEAVTAVQRKGEAKGVGAVAGGVLGAVVGNQIGNGGGRTAATVLGALGGGYAGHTIEKNVRKETVYQVRVRMQDGSVRNIEQASAPATGARVVVEGTTMRSAG